MASLSGRVLALAAVLSVIGAGSVFAQSGKKQMSGGYVVADSDGKMRDSYNVNDVTRTDTGTYKVDFSSSIEGCVAVANVNSDNNGTTAAGLISVSNTGNGNGGNQNGSGKGNSVRVSTFSPLTGLATDLPFDLQVTCGSGK